VIGFLYTATNDFEKGHASIATVIKNDMTEFYHIENDDWIKINHVTVNLCDIFQRTPFPERLMKVIGDSKIVLFGLGSMGSRLATGLARSGIGNFKLVDPDVVSIENLSRHECDLSDLYRQKVVAVRDKIHRINPNAVVEVYDYDIFKAEKEVRDEVFREVDLVIATTDKKSVQLKVNEACFDNNTIGLFSGCYEEAKGGEVFYVIPGETKICYECLRGGIQRPERLGKIDYSKAQSSEDYEGEPGLNAAINFVTDVAQQFAIALLLRKEDCEIAKVIEPQKNLLLIGGLLGRGYYFFRKPFDIIRPTLTGPWKECGTCQDNNQR
jgi:molybdopterin/thiamine biosynthesis adenylyltransferase